MNTSHICCSINVLNFCIINTVNVIIAFCIIITADVIIHLCLINTVNIIKHFCVIKTVNVKLLNCEHYYSWTAGTLLWH